MSIDAQKSQGDSGNLDTLRQLSRSILSFKNNSKGKIHFVVSKIQQGQNKKHIMIVEGILRSKLEHTVGVAALHCPIRCYQLLSISHDHPLLCILAILLTFWPRIGKLRKLAYEEAWWAGKKKLKFKNCSSIDPRCLNSPLSSWTRKICAREPNVPGQPRTAPSWSYWAHGSGTTRIVANDFWSRQLWSWTHICHHPQRPTKSWQRAPPFAKWFKTIFWYGSLLTKKKLEKAHAVDAMINHFSTKLLVESLSLEIVFSHVHHLPTSPRKDPWPGVDRSYPFFK